MAKTGSRVCRLQQLWHMGPLVVALRLNSYSLASRILVPNQGPNLHPTIARQILNLWNTRKSLMCNFLSQHLGQPPFNSCQLCDIPTLDHNISNDSPINRRSVSCLFVCLFVCYHQQCCRRYPRIKFL